MKTLKRLLFFMAGICLLIACSKSDNFWGNDSFGNSDKNCQIKPIVDHKYAPGTIYNLSGLSLYKAWEVKSGKIWLDYATECVGTLEFLEGMNFKYTFQETAPDGNGAEFYGKISKSGDLTFKFPVPLATLDDGTNINITDILKEHVCAEGIWREGVKDGTLVFHGKFNGNKFNATSIFMVKVASPCDANDVFDPALVTNPLYWTFGYDLKVVKKEKD
jgi:hypothetical protein